MGTATSDAHSASFTGPAGSSYIPSEWISEVNHLMLMEQMVAEDENK